MTPPTVLRSVHLRIRGRVQGVGFRYSASEAARRFGVRGWVRNTFEGDVEAVAQGDGEAVERFIAWCRRGPAGARVDSVDERPDSTAQTYPDFTIRR